MQCYVCVCVSLLDLTPYHVLSIVLDPFGCYVYILEIDNVNIYIYIYIYILERESFENNAKMEKIKRFDVFF